MNTSGSQDPLPATPRLGPTVYRSRTRGFVRPVSWYLLGGTAVVAAIWSFACSSDRTTAPTPTEPAEVAALRAALAPYGSLALAKNAGYNVALTDCMSNGDIGAMGIHFGKPDLIDGTLDAEQPEVLIYEPGASGEMSFVGVEFVVPFAIVPETAAPPELFGRQFIPNDVFGLWTLHVWTHRANPSGLFASWNPRVHCS
jgi:hypothetical protein